MSSGLGSELVTLVNKLQDAFAAVGSSGNQIDLPQICVLGSQSSGKSSVLENIVGRDFLPRGSGIVTRRPLVLQLINRKSAGGGTKTAEATAAAAAAAAGSDKNANAEEWGEFLHLPGQKFYDFTKIRDEIVRDTEAKTGRNAGISPLPINLRIFSPNVLTLTLVDLPGITKVPVGDQPKDIERQIRDMLFKYITRPSCIILAVTPANVDLANSEGLKMAREVDMDGTRTLGVLTKVDLMDKGTDVVGILAGRVIPLRLGYVPVVNRGQKDIEGNKSISAALDAERDFFSNHPSYKGKENFCGTPFLTRRLNALLMNHIRTVLPDIKLRISQQLTKYNAELQSLGGLEADASAGNVVLSVITEFTTEFRNYIDGYVSDLNLEELSGGARISFVYHELYNNGIRNVDPFDQVNNEELRTLTYNSSGLAPSLFAGTAAFEGIVKGQIKRLEEPSLKCCQLIYDELVRILGQLLNKIAAFKRYPALKDSFNTTIISFFKQRMTPTTKLVSDLVAMQACYVNTTHPDFLNGHVALAIVNERLNPPKPPSTPEPKRDAKQREAELINNNRNLDVDPKSEDGGFFGSFLRGRHQKKPTGMSAGSTPPTPSKMEAPPTIIRPQAAFNERETMETEVIKLLITSYFNIVKREMIDTVPKAITLSLVTYAKDNLQKQLLQDLYKPDVLDGLMKESEHVVNRRKEVIGMVKALNKAEEIVAGV